MDVKGNTRQTVYMCVEEVDVVVVVVVVVVVDVDVDVYVSCFSKHHVHGGNRRDLSGHLGWNSNSAVQQKKMP